jgi:hypothetical protein
VLLCLCTRVIPSCLLLVDCLEVAATQYNDALAATQRSRRSLTRHILAAYLREPWTHAFRSVTYKEFWASPDYSALHLARTVDSDGCITDLVFLQERYACGVTERAISWLARDETLGLEPHITPKHILCMETKRMTFAMPSDPDSPQALVRQTLLYLGPRCCPTPCTLPLEPRSDIFHYSGHQRDFFFAGLSMGLRVELRETTGEAARKKLCLPAQWPTACAVCQEPRQFYVVHRHCGHAVCCTECMESFFDVDRRREHSAHQCPICRAVFRPGFPSRLLELDSARTSYALDRDTTLKLHRRTDALSTTCAQLYMEQMTVPTIAEVLALDQQDDEDRLRESLGIASSAWPAYAQRNFEALHGLCKRLKWYYDMARPACIAWQIVLEYVAFGSARFFNVSVETTEPIGEAEPGWRYALVDRHYRQPA